MRLLLINRALGTLYGGGEAFDLNCSKNLIGRGHSVEIITGKNLIGETLKYDANVRISYVKTPNFRWFSYLSAKKLSKISAFFYYLDNWIFEILVFLNIYRNLKAGKIDIVQCCSLFLLPQLIFLVAPTVRVVSWLPGPPANLTVMQIKKLLKNKNFGLFFRGETQAYLEKKNIFLSDRCYVVEPGIDFHSFQEDNGTRKLMRRKLGISENEIVSITIGRLVDVKNTELILEAASKYKALGKARKWLILGDGPLYTGLKNKSKTLSLEREVLFLKHVENESVPLYLQASDVFILPSNYESFSIATLEAMAAGLPIILSNKGYLPHLAKQSTVGICFDNSNVDNLIVCIEDVLKQHYPESCKTKGKEYAARFDWSKICTKLEILYANLRKN